MRKTLLATAAMLGATAGIASAQAPQPATASMMMQPSQGQFALPWAQGPTVNNNNNSTGAPSSYVGASAFGKNAVPSPGTVVIRLNGRVESDMMVSWSTNHQVLGAKTNPINFSSYMRLSPGVDGMATNGLRYGAAIELRQNIVSTSQPNPALGSAAGAASPFTGGAAPSPSAYNSGQTVFVRRAFTYLAHDNFGLVRIGVTDGVIGLWDPAIYSGAGWDGGHGALNGAGPQASGVNGAFAIPYVLAQAGAEYANVKIVYLTPQFFGFDFGVQYAPSMGNGFSACNAAGFACNSATTGNDPTRWYNQVAAGARWQGVFGPVSLGVYGVYETAGKESFFGAPVANRFGAAGTQFDNLSFFTGATYVTFNSPIGAFSASATYLGGAVNGQLAMRPTGGVTQHQVVGGVSYRNGPITLGTQVNFLNSQGAAALTGVSQRHEFTVAAGGSYTLAPGVVVYAEYQYATRHQGGFDFIAGALGSRAGIVGSGAACTSTWKAGQTRDAHGQALLIGTAVSW